MRRANARYSGALELEYEKRITLKAIGLITMGSDGYSLLIVITSSSPPSSSAWASLSTKSAPARLEPHGDVERLRTGIRDKTLDSVLFPENVVENADRILSDLSQVFPVQPDRFIFGPMARICWGTPPLITADVGLLIELPEPVRMLLLGVVKAILPMKRTPCFSCASTFWGHRFRGASLFL